MLTYREAMRQARREYLKRALAEAGGNVSAAARLAGTARWMFYKNGLKRGRAAKARSSLSAALRSW